MEVESMEIEVCHHRSARDQRSGGIATGTNSNTTRVLLLAETNAARAFPAAGLRLPRR
jgi:hypothetical protein